jgi:hypothetical protein
MNDVSSLVHLCSDEKEKTQKNGLNRLSPSLFALSLFALLCSLFLVATCSDRMPRKKDFTDWLLELYHKETGLVAAQVMICRWERTSKDITRVAPEVDGLQVEAAVFSNVSDTILRADSVETVETIVHYVFCRYFVISDEWYLHASSWGGGFWKQDPNEWGQLVTECLDRVQQIKEDGTMFVEKE